MINRIKLEHLVELMESENYRDRFVAEYIQTKQRYEKLHFGFLLLVLVNDLTCILLQAFEVVDFVESMTVMIAMLVIMVLLTLGTIILDWVKKRLEEYRLVAIGCIGILFSGILTIYFMNIFDGKTWDEEPIVEKINIAIMRCENEN